MINQSVCIKNGQSQEWCQTHCENVKMDSVTHGNSLDLLKCLPAESVDLVVTSPPYAGVRANQYEVKSPKDYNAWFLPIAQEIKRVLKPTGSFVLNIKEGTQREVRHPYVYQLVLSLIDEGWKWIETYVRYKPNPVPHPIKLRPKDAFEHIYHFTKELDFKRNWDAVKVPSKSLDVALARARTRKDYHATKFTPSGWSVKISNFEKLDGKTLPNNVLIIGAGENKSKHPAVYPEKLPEFFIKAFTEKGDVVLDPFMGSGTSGAVAKKYCRHFLGFDKKQEYVQSANDRIGKEVMCSKNNDSNIE